MFRLAYRLFFSLCFMSFIMLSPAAADSLVSLMGWPFDSSDAPGLTYATGAANGTDPIPRRINFIQYPVLGFPALLTEEEDLLVIVAYGDEEQLLGTSQWRVSLVSGFANPADAHTWVGDPIRQRIDLPVEAVEYDTDSGTYHVACGTPPNVPIDLYALEVETTAFRDVQPGAVSMAESYEDSFTFAHLTDPRIGDPLAEDVDNALNGGNYPGCGLGDRALTLFEQEILGELAWRRPAFAMLTGNLAFGLDLDTENEALVRILQNSRTPIMTIPGNRDGYAHFTGPHVEHDGLEHFARLFGPTYYSYDVGSLHFVAINSFDGAAGRRQGKYQILDTAADNRGGFVGRDQLAWLAADLRQASANGQTSILFLHHDPRGPYLPNDPYPTAPYRPAELEYWNYESADWDSDPLDDIENETPGDNTGIALLALALENGVSHLFIGHARTNAVWHFAAGDALIDRSGNPVGGLLAVRPLTIVQTTTAAGTPGEGAAATDADGYRLVQATGSVMTNLNFDDTRTPIMPTVPAGNFWVEEYNNDGTFEQAQIVIHNGLPTAFPITLEFYLAGNPGGYEILREKTQTNLLIAGVGLGENGEAILYAQTSVDSPEAAGASFPVATGQETREAFTARRNYANQPPTASFTVIPTEEENIWFFDGSTSADPEGEALYYVWNFGDGETTIGRTVNHTYRSGGLLLATLTVLDASAGQDTAEVLLDIGDGCWDCEHDDGDDDECGGCDMNDSRGSAGPLLLLLTALAPLVFGVRRRARSRR